MHLAAKAILCLVLAYSLPALYRFCTRTGLAVPRLDHAPGPCRLVDGVDCGSEDIEATSDGLAFISGGYRGLRECGGKHRGRIYLFDFGNPDTNVTKLTIESETIDREKFEPHGMGLLEDKTTGDIRLFVVDHSEAEDVVRIFLYNRDNKYTLRHIDDVRDSTFLCLNDVQPTGPRSFYVTNCLRFCRYLHRHRDYEGFLQLLIGLANIVHYDGKGGRIVVDGLQLVNGIEMSLDGKFIFGLTIDGSLNVFKRDVQNNSVSSNPVHKIPLKTIGDNVNIDASGDLFIGGIPSIWMLMYGDYDGPNASPAQVVRVHPTSLDWSTYEVTETLYNSGINFVRWSSSAYHYDRQLLIGTVEHKLGYCRMETMY